MDVDIEATPMNKEAPASEMPTPTTEVRAQGPRIHEAKQPSALVALSMSLMDDFEDVERGLTPSVEPR